MYLNLIQIAESFGVSESVIEGWVRQEGMPHTLDRDRLLFERAPVVEWAAARGLATRAGFLAAQNTGPGTACRLAPLLRAGGIWREVAADGVIEVLARIVAALPGATPAVRQLLAQRLRGPGGITWAPVGHGFALPHPSNRIALGRDAGIVALICLRDTLPQAEPTPDGVPVRWVFFFIAPSPRAHLELLGRLGRGLGRGTLRDCVTRGDADAAILKAAEAADALMDAKNTEEGR